MSAGRTAGSELARIGSWCWDHARAVALMWLLAAIAASFVASRLPERLLSGSGDIAGSMSLRVDRALRTDFAASFGQSLIMPLRSPSLAADPGQENALVARLVERLEREGSIAGVTADADMPDQLRPPDAAGRFLLIELRTVGQLAAEQQVPVLRRVIAPIMADAKWRHPDLQWALTGQAALTYDLNRFNAEDAARSELRTLPLTLLVLVIAFGSLVAAAIPLLLAVATRAVALGLVWLVAGPFETSNLVPSIVTMLALALGIDFSLFILHRFRQALRTGADRRSAMQLAMAQSGSAVLYSGVTVAIGMGALLTTPLMQTRSIGLGGLLVVVATLAIALTLIPALLRLISPRLLEWPEGLSRRITGERSRRWWRHWADIVMRRPIAVIAASLAALLLLAAPAVQSRFGFPDGEFLPPELEYSRGLALLAGMGLGDLVSPIPVVIRSASDTPAMATQHLPALQRFGQRLDADPRVRTVLGPLPSASERLRTPSSMEEAVGRALERERYISGDGRRLLFQIIPAGQEFATMRDFSRALPGLIDDGNLRVEVGGQAQYYNDLEASVARSFPWAVGLTLAMSALALLLVFRAPLVAAKALLLNALSVAAGYGMVVWVFQLGNGSDLFGLAGGTGVVPISIPLLIFCITFGLSMDYEIFLLSRARAFYLETGDNRHSVREALAETGAVITSAALIMVLVFGAFALARVVAVQMLGLGLAIAVLVDATLIRSALGPALMQIAGRWNWWPGVPRP